MTTTAVSIPADLQTLIEDALADELTSDFVGGDLAAFLDMDEDTFVARFGADLTWLLDAEITGEIEAVQTCCVTFDCPGWIVDVGEIEISVPADVKTTGRNWRTLATIDVNEDVVWTWKV